MLRSTCRYWWQLLSHECSRRFAWCQNQRSLSKLGISNSFQTFLYTVIFLGLVLMGFLKSCTTVNATNEDMMVAHTLCLNKRLISVLSTMILTISSGMTMKVRVDIFRIFCKFLVFNPKKMSWKSWVWRRVAYRATVLAGIMYRLAQDITWSESAKFTVLWIRWAAPWFVPWSLSADSGGKFWHQPLF